MEEYTVSGFGVEDRFGPANSRPRTVTRLMGNVGRNGGHRALLNMANSNGAFAVTGMVRRIGHPILVLRPGGALTTRVYSRFHRFFPSDTIRFFISCCSCCRPRTCVPSASMCVRGSSSMGSRVSHLHRSTATTLDRHHSIVVITSMSYVCSLNSPRRCGSVIIGLHINVAGSHSRLLDRLIKVRFRHGSVSFRHGHFEIEKSMIRVLPAQDRSITIHIRFFNSRVSHLDRVGVIANRILHAVARMVVFPTSRCVADGSGLRSTVRSVRARVHRHMRCFGSRSGLVTTRQVRRQIGCSVRVLLRINFYSNIRGCSEILSHERPNTIPFALLSFLPSSFVLMISRSRMTLPRMEKVCTNSETEGRALIRCNFHLPSTLSGHPLAFSRFCDRVSRTVFMSTAPNGLRGRRSRTVIRRVVHPAKLLSPRIRMEPARKRVRSLVLRVGRQIRGGRHILMAALAIGVTRSLATSLRNMKVGIGCVRRSVSAVRHVRVVHSLHLNRFSILMNVGLLHRNLSLPRMSLMTVLSTSGRNFLEDRDSLIRAVNHTTEGTNNGIVVCTSSMANSVRETVDRARHHHTVRVGCGRSRNVAPGAVVGNMHSMVRVSGGRAGGSLGRCAGHRGTRLVSGVAGRVERTTHRLRFRRTTCLHSGVGRLEGD